MQGASDALARQSKTHEERMTVINLRILGECVIDVGNRPIAPDSPQLFAFLLYMCRAAGRPVHRSQLVELIGPEVKHRDNALHNLRQLTYRLRRHGTPLETHNELIRLPTEFIASTLNDFLSLSRADRLGTSPSRLAILPSYEPAITPQYSDWLEMTRSHDAAVVRSILRDDFRAFKTEHNWKGVVVIGATLRALDNASEELVTGIAEALFMLGRKSEAVDQLDEFLEESEASQSSAVRQLRHRLAKARQPARALECGFYGRADVMRSLVRQWDCASALLPQLAVVSGPAGIGKTRVADEFRAFALLNGGQCLIYRCDSSDAARPLALFRSLLPQLLSMRGSLGAAPELQQHLARVASDATLDGPPEPATSEATRADIQLALIDLLDAVASEKPLGLLVDDAHLLDAASTGILRALIERRVQSAVMLVCCYRGSGGDYLHASDHTRRTIHQLTPLADAESISILRDLLPRALADDAFLHSCAARAGGNPYYLHAIAHAACADRLSEPMPFDILQFASSSYFSLPTDARTLFETCLLLGRFATLQKVREIADVDGPPLISALRALESHGMLYFAGGELRCSHALLEEASRPLIPTSVAALLHQRIAQSLEQDCKMHQYPTALTWAAAEHWIAAGNEEAAAVLLQRCASQAAAIGEPRSAANALLHIPLDRLDVPNQCTILNQIVEYAEAAGDRDQVLSSLRTLQVVSREHCCGPEMQREIDFRVIETELRHGGVPDSAVAPLSELLRDTGAPPVLRLRAGIRLLIAADISLDVDLAESTYRLLPFGFDQAESAVDMQHQADVVYHTVFGDQSRAIHLIADIIRQHPTPAIAQTGASRRRNAGYALARMGRGDLARPILLADYSFMLQRHVTSEALFAMIVLAESYMYDGDLSTAHSWLQQAAVLVEKEPQTRALQGGYYSAAAAVALADGRLEHAERFVNEAHRRFPAIRAPRYEAVEMALRLRIQLERGDCTVDERVLARLYELYNRGAHLGAQDCIVEVLWLSERALGHFEIASELLRDYLTCRRREQTAAEWSLRRTTSSEPIWLVQ